MKKFKKFLLLPVILCCVLFLGGCSTTYTLNSSFSEINAKDYSLEEVYEAYLTATNQTSDEYSFEKFLKEFYLSSESEDKNTTAINTALRSAVIIYCPVTTNGMTTNYSCGSGVIYKIGSDGDGTYTAYVVTNYHVIYEGELLDNIYCYLYGKDSFNDSSLSKNYGMSATLLGGSSEYDIALLQITGSTVLDNAVKDDSIKAVTFADSDEMKLGQTAIAVGNANGEGFSSTVGSVSVLSEYITLTSPVDDSKTITKRVFRIDTAVNGGNSGGGIFNSDGELLGLLEAKVEDETIEGMGYAIPSNQVKAVVENILRNADGGETPISVSKPTLGITFARESVYSEDDLSGEGVYAQKIIISDVSRYIQTSGKNASTGASARLSVGDVLNSITITYSSGETETYNITEVYQAVEITLLLSVDDVITFNVTKTNNLTSTEEDLSVSYTITSSLMKTVA